MMRVLVALLTALVLSGCAGTPTPPHAVRVGSGPDAESRLLAEIYAQGLRLRGVPVDRVALAGPRERYLPALAGGGLDVVPEYTGYLLGALDPGATATAPAEVYDRARAALPPTLTLLAPASAQHSEAVVVTRGYAERHALDSVADLAPLCPTLVLAGPPSFTERPDGLGGLARTYGCTVAGFRPLDGPRGVAALRAGEVQAATLVTTDPAIAADDLAVLADPRGNFAAQNVVPLVARATAADVRVTEVLDRISAQLDTAVLTDLNRQLAAPDHPDAAEVARSWLASAGVG